MDDRGWKWIALLSLLGLGGLTYFLLRRQGSLLGAAGSPTVYFINNNGGGQPGGGQPSQVLAGPALTMAPDIDTSKTSAIERLERGLGRIIARLEAPISNNFIQSYELPVLGSNTGAARVCQALATPFDVVLRVVGPPGSLAVFAPTTTDLDVGGAVIPVGNTLIVPAGSEHRIRLTPHQTLYGKGNVSGVVVSVNATEAASRSFV